ncbi:glycerophosphodiester phosphodiesterase [Geminicoccus harenae]|uniref:glycerophosphodiester phosphodiesterase n=2 Tax=Geminicoccus harenae TaxID=2498453 RepID=UPI00210622BD|nr:glycerophosphodiester phosphodiesterase [Geminicoccus harenae]
MTVEQWPVWKSGLTAVPTLPMPFVVGHRGSSAHAPENTLSSIRKAAEQGCRMVEFDVKLSRDRVAFLMHDSALSRTTNGKGWAARRDWAEIRELDAGSWFSLEAAGEHPPSLEEVVALLVELDLQANIEIKPCPGRDLETAEVVCGELKLYWPDSKAPPLLSSFSRASLEAAKRVAPYCPRGLLVERLPRDWRQAMERLGCSTLHMSQKYADPARIAELGAEGVPVLVYTVNDPDQAARLRRAGAVAVFTDAPDRLLAALETA